MGRINLPAIRVPFGPTKLAFDVSWLLSAPATLGAIGTIFVPVLGTSLSGWQVWTAAAAITILAVISLVIHCLAHVIASVVLNYPLPEDISIFLLGDSAQQWSLNPMIGKEILRALAGPAASCLLAFLMYIFWKSQGNAFLSVISFFLIFFNIAVAAINITPAFPFDGGRIFRSIVHRMFSHTRLANRALLLLGIFISIGFMVWGVILIAVGGILSLQTGIASIVFAVIILFGLNTQDRYKWEQTNTEKQTDTTKLGFRILFAALTFVPMLALTSCFVPLDYGLEAPGFTASVEPMVRLPANLAHASSGSLILTTVIPQAPILFGEWVYGHIDHSIQLEPVNQVVTPNTSIQQTSQQQYHELLDSSTTAVVVGLRLSGYQVNVSGNGVEVVSVLSESLAKNLLEPGDIINSINDNPVHTISDLSDQLKSLTENAVIKMQIVRDSNTFTIDVPTLSPATPDGPVRLGIDVQTNGSSYQLPLPIRIVPQKVAGGPSAGLMFTLGVYNLLSSKDITGGRMIAGTGTIDFDGNVGAIGGVQQKVVAAEHAGAEYFLVPPGNYEDALAAARSIKIVKVATAQDAIDFLKNLPPIKTL